MADKVVCVGLVLLTLVMLAIAAITVPNSSKPNKDIQGITGVR